MMWQYITLGVILAAVVGIVVVRLLPLSKKDDAVENPFCAGCALAKNCKRRSVDRLVRTLRCYGCGRNIFCRGLQVS